MVFKEGKTAAEAARATDIVVRTGQDYVRKARLFLEEERIAEEEEVVPPVPSVLKDRKHGSQKLFQAYSLFFLDFFKKHADATLNQAREAMMNAFPCLEITISAISNHIKKHCNLTMKRLEKIPPARNHKSTLAKRKEKLEEWLALADFDYMKSCVVIDEAGFNLRIRRTFGRSVRGTPAKIEVATQRGVSITIIDAMCEKGIVNLMMRKPTAVSSKKKRKLKMSESGVDAVNGRVGTRTSHYLQFLEKTMDVLDASGLGGCYLVMDNAPIHKSDEVQKLICSRRYKYMYLLTYSPFFNPIEEM